MVTPEPIKKRARTGCYGKPAKILKRHGDPSKYGGQIVKDQTGEYREFRRLVKCDDGNRKTIVRFYGPLNVNTRVWCSCSCPYFLYHCEVALTLRGSSSIIFSNGKMPNQTNPRRIPYVCKHVIVAFALALKGRVPGKGVFAKNTTPGDRVLKAHPHRTWYGDNTVSKVEPIVLDPKLLGK